MEEWEYRTITMYLEKWERMHKKYEDYVITYTDGTRLEGVEAVLRRYLDDGGWDLVSMVPTGFRTRISSELYQSFDADTLTLIFRRKRLVP